MARITNKATKRSPKKVAKTFKNPLMQTMTGQAPTNAFPPGNELWRKVKNPGIQQKYESDELWQKALEYFEWASTNPWKKEDFVKGGMNAGDVIKLNVERPLLIEGFCVFAGMSDTTFRNYEQGKGVKQPADMISVCACIRQVIRTHKLEGALVGVFNPQIAAHVLGFTGQEHSAPSVSITWNETKNYKKK